MLYSILTIKPKDSRSCFLNNKISWELEESINEHKSKTKARNYKHKNYVRNHKGKQLKLWHENNFTTKKIVNFPIKWEKREQIRIF